MRVVRVLVILIFFAQVDNVGRALLGVNVHSPLFGICLIVLHRDLLARLFKVLTRVVIFLDVHVVDIGVFVIRFFVAGNSVCLSGHHLRVLLDVGRSLAFVVDVIFLGEFPTHQLGILGGHVVSGSVRFLGLAFFGVQIFKVAH